jgi:hypothetical protein
MTSPFLLTLTALEATLMVLYSTANLDEATRNHRAELAHVYHDRTGRWFAARFY